MLVEIGWRPSLLGWHDPRRKEIFGYNLRAL